MESYGDLWRVMGTYGELWALMESYGHLWRAMGIPGELWASMDSYVHSRIVFACFGGSSAGTGGYCYLCIALFA